MTLVELVSLLKTLGYPLAYSHFSKPQPLPFLVYLNPSDNTVGADNKVLHKTRNINVEVYTDEKDLTLEAKIEKLFDENEIYYDNPDEIFIQSENVYKRTYYITI
ncbi:hypothetical protein [Rummeliibacillus stabekisii]|uniref:hypothetical protein n=1 Tax=Rummeliibacillus stabekisii TaxID=241244 RepID=UPI0037142174